jgi:hypothetical protein
VSAVRDRDRQAVYDAEDAAFGGTTWDEAMPFDAAADLAGAFCASRWWAAFDLPAPAVVATRADSHTSYARWEGEPTIHLSPAGCTVATLAHELAHLVAQRAAGDGEPAHGPAFRRADVTLAAALMGGAAAARLASAFLGAGLDLGPEEPGTLPTPPHPDGFWPGWRAARTLAAAEPAARGPIAL